MSSLVGASGEDKCMRIKIPKAKSEVPRGSPEAACCALLIEV